MSKIVIRTRIFYINMGNLRSDKFVDVIKKFKNDVVTGVDLTATKAAFEAMNVKFFVEDYYVPCRDIATHVVINDREFVA